MMKKPGFTLAETLIALALLGVIAAFAIPKVIESQQTERTKTVCKEIHGILSTVVYEAYIKNDPDIITNLLKNLNSRKYCAQAMVNGCSSVVRDGGGGNSDWTNREAVILHNGALVLFQGSDTVGYHVLVDWNGDLPPNIFGGDIFAMCFMQSNKPEPGVVCDVAYSSGNGMTQGGKIYPSGLAMYRTLFDKWIVN